MPNIIYHVASSMDGFIADKDGKVDWLNEFDGFADDEVLKDFQDFMNSFGAILVGGHTYDFTLEYGQWMSPGFPTWVFTERNLKLLDPCIQLTNESPLKICGDLKQSGIERAWLMGGGKLAASFQNEGLIDEIHLAIIPIFLGQGIPLMGKTTQDPKLTLMDSKSYSNGIVSAKYKVQSA